jgi:hypothetical protein
MSVPVATMPPIRWRLRQYVIHGAANVTRGTQTSFAR